MKNLINQRGSTLLLAIGVLLIFAVLGISLITLSATGLNKNELREDTVQSQNLSEMGLEFVTSEIYYTLQKELTSKNGLSVRAYVTYLEQTLNSYLCFNTFATNVPRTVDQIKAGTLSPKLKQVNSKTGDGEYCILNYQDNIMADGNTNPLKKDVKLISIGVSGARDAVLISTVEIGTDSVPDHLNYVIGTNITSNTGIGTAPPPNGEGNLLLHGGVEIKGDMKVEGNIITRDFAYGGGQWVDSVLPRMVPFRENTQANLVLGGNAYKLNREIDYNTHINNSTFDRTNYTLTSNINDLFHTGYDPKIVKRTPVKTPINITGQRANYHYLKGGSVSNKPVTSTSLSNQNFSNQKVFYTHQYRECTFWILVCLSYKDATNDSADYTLSGTNIYNSLSIPGNLTLSANGSSLTTKKDNSGNGGTLYVGNDLTIGNGKQDNLSDKPDISINGAIYIDGDLKIQGADLFTNALIYVDGNVTLKFSTVKGLNLGNNKTGSLVIFATGNIDISNNSVDTDPNDPNGPSIITGFFYSEKNFEMYGVGSNMIINGGVSANRIVLNGIRGRSSIGTYHRELKRYTSDGNVYYWENAANQNARKARLQINYNPDIITTFSDLRQKEQIITYVDPSVIKEQEIR